MGKRTAMLAVCLFFMSQVSFAEEKKDVVKDALDVPGKALKATGEAIKGKKDKKDEEEVKPRIALKDLPREEIVEHTKEIIDRDEDVLGSIPELKQARDKQGNVSYEYKGKKIEDLDKDTLITLSNRVTNESNKLHMDKLIKQLDMIRRSQQATDAARQAATANPRPPTIPQPPPNVPYIPRAAPPVIPQVTQTQRPPQIPQTPPSPPNVPRAPQAAPPAPPRR